MDTPEEQQYFYKMFDDIYKDNCTVSLIEKTEKLEKDSIRNALYEANGNRTLAAKKLGIGRTCLLAKMRKYNIS